MIAFVNALLSLLALYGLGARGQPRRRVAPVHIGRQSARW